MRTGFHWPRLFEEVVIRHRSVLFLVSFLIATVAVSLVGWFTDVRGVMHSVLLGVFVTAFFPFVFVAAVACVVVGFVLLLAVLSLFGAGDGAGDVADAGTDLAYSSVRLSRWGAPRYYAILMSIRHPAIWGSVVGLLAGGLLLWGLVSWIIVPRELATSRVLAETAEQLMRTQRQTGQFPDPLPGGFINRRDVGQAGDGPVLDAFERPIQFTVSGASLFASFTLKSAGFDGKPSRDDLCVSGAAQGAKWAASVDALLSGFRLGKEGKPPRLKERLRSLHALRCDS